MHAKKIGLLVNPYAGLGGKVALKGSDGRATVDKALSLGAVSPAPQQALRALEALRGTALSVLTAGGPMGEDICRHVGLLQPTVLYRAARTDTGPSDTADAARALLAGGAELILFAGGDGTARDIAAVVQDCIPLIGVPAGVKMYSGVFAINAVNAGLLAQRFVAEREVGLKTVEILDIDEDSLRRGRPDTRLYSYAKTLSDPRIQLPKAASHQDEVQALGALCRQIGTSLEAGRLHILGPGATMLQIKQAAGIDGTLLGVDAIMNGQALLRDVGEAQLLHALEGRQGRICIGVIGGTGCLFGRGNQQIGARVIAAVGRQNIRVVASQQKLATLGAEGFFVDTGEEEVDAMLRGHILVDTEINRRMVVPVR